ncbi:MAG: hypothetical protein ACD_65C00029G0002 [uncultured bacterium]|nr:MAG: hypothetical protein ACD_65C00029G0002 [uncultured bacterium]KKT02428.1 MAG: hypothetical protein UV80_C0003G0014 [Candidatus Peregrinibacteria bacterium GW2011_GWF2_43_17]KKT19343.1 MAG: hypothetical protein UW03_C0020G0048 [Candidatus Peregrinibacteria bacterium GW2011_GWA2_43_8]
MEATKILSITLMLIYLVRDLFYAGIEAENGKVK